MMLILLVVGYLNCAGPVCTEEISLPEHSTKTETMTDNLLGQTVTITCNTGYEFPSAPETFTAPSAPVVTALSPLILTQGQWSAWGAWSPCSVTCGAGTMTRYRDCGQEGMCVGNIKETQDCDEGDCGKMQHIIS